MKIFWSWQSDTPGKTGRHFIRSAIEDAVAELKAPPALEEAVRGIHLDHDRKGVPGSPDLVATILAKIRKSAVFVADVTLVGKASKQKQLINSNVAIELGFALGVLGDEKLLMIMNEHYGIREKLPFDLKHKAGPILYRLGPTATASEIRAEKRRLTSAIKEALRAFARSPAAESATVAHAHVEQATTANRAVYFSSDQVLGTKGGNGSTIDYRCRATKLLYLRLIPAIKQRPLKRSEAIEVLQKSGIAPLGHDSGHAISHNSFGAIAFAEQSRKQNICGLTQVLLNRELWGVAAVSLYRPLHEDTAEEMKSFAVHSFERDFFNAVFGYLAVARDHLKIAGPLIIEAGGVGIRGLLLHIDIGPFSHQLYGPILDEHFFSRSELSGDDKSEVEKAILQVFESLFDVAGSARPKTLFNFPNRR